MKSKQTIIAAIIAVFVLAGGAIAFQMNSGSDDSASKSMEKSNSEDVMEKNEDVMEKSDEVMEKNEDAAMMSDHGAYVTLADFENDPEKYSDTKNVYFFHASWCPTCRAIDEDIRSDVGQIPAGTTIIKTDFDSETSLRQKFGVTTQYTFVQVDSNGEEINQWSATNLQKALAGIQ